MKTKLLLAILGVALVAAALVGVTTAQFVGAQNQNQINPIYQTNPYCINQTTGEPYCYTNGTYTGYCWNGTNTGYNQNGGYCNGYGCAAQNQNQYSYGAGMMERNSGYGRGCSR
jgi:hypothetical protein